MNWFDILKQGNIDHIRSWARDRHNESLKEEIERQKTEGENIIGPFYYKREFVIANTGSGWIPFYKSSGTHGIKDMWSPFGGFTNDDWVIKPTRMEMFQDDPQVKEFRQIVRENDRAKGEDKKSKKELLTELAYLNEPTRRTSDPNVHAMTEELAGKTLQDPMRLTRDEANAEIRDKYGEISLAW